MTPNPARGRKLGSYVLVTLVDAAGLMTLTPRGDGNGTLRLEPDFPR